VTTIHRVISHSSLNSVQGRPQPYHGHQRRHRAGGGAETTAVLNLNRRPSCGRGRVRRRPWRAAAAPSSQFSSQDRRG